jgi:uncharacterized protein with GYD domain
MKPIFLLFAFLAMTMGWAPVAFAQEAPAPATPEASSPSVPAIDPAMLEAMGVLVRMPGESHRGALPPLTEREKALEAQLRRDTQILAGDIGERNIWKMENLDDAADYIGAEFRAAGLNAVFQSYEVQGGTFRNVEAEVLGSGRAGEILIVSGHYDTVVNGPGADDNASGVAGTLALARAFAGKTPQRTLRFVCFANEEMLGAPENWAGSVHYAKRCRERGEKIIGNINLDTIGYFSDAPNSQKYPAPLNLFYPTTADFIGVLADSGSKEFAFEIIEKFRRLHPFPCEGLVAPRTFPELGRHIGRSDQRSFWDEGYPGVMITDTANFRYEHYHLPPTRPIKLTIRAWPAWSRG